ncbi:MAG: S4 domain-containing protein [Candidatus Micrarchaeota archaeon]|nr:S4 domain-containing protein [Candidatus Micrarchaeota archaeon]
MSKKGGSSHFVRLRAHKRVGVVKRKAMKWLLSPAAGPHRKEDSISAGVLVRDVLGRAKTMREVKKLLNAGGLVVDGKKVKDPKRPIGLMDIVSEPMESKLYRMSLSGPKLVPKPISEKSSARKYLKVVGKRTVRGAKIALTFHDGRNYIGDNNIKNGDTCVFSVPDFKLLSHIKLQPGARCLIVEGKHRGEIAKLEQIIQRPGSHATEALLSGQNGQFVTVAKYLFAVDDEFDA